MIRYLVALACVLCTLYLIAIYCRYLVTTAPIPGLILGGWPFLDVQEDANDD